MSKDIHPACITETAFDCPHCGAYTSQQWYDLYATETPENPKLKINVPFFPDLVDIEQARNNHELKFEEVRDFTSWVEKKQNKLVFLGGYIFATGSRIDVNNLYISECYVCNKFSVWVHNSLVFPVKQLGVTPNRDLPEDIISDFNEARSILNISPRGAAALLRLCIQKLCKHLGEKGRNINEDIASLVSKGLDPKIQKALDVVRVIGNDAVHPGSIDIKDDQNTVLKLLNIINFIATQMITHPKNIDELFNSLPDNKLEEIEIRNNRAKPNHHNNT